MQFSGPCWAHTIHLLVSQVQLFCADRGKPETNPTKPPNRLHSTGLLWKHSLDAVWMTAVNTWSFNPFVESAHLYTLVCCSLYQDSNQTHQTGSSSGTQRSQQGSGSSSNAIPASRCLSSFLLSEETTGEREKPTGSIAPTLAFPHGLKHKHLALFLLQTSYRLCKCMFEEFLLCLWKKSYSTSIIIFPASSITVSVEFHCLSYCQLWTSSFLLPYIYKIKSFGALCMLPGEAANSRGMTSPGWWLLSDLQSTILIFPHGKLLSLCSFGNTHARAALGMMIFMLALPLQHC